MATIETITEKIQEMEQPLADAQAAIILTRAEQLQVYKSVVKDKMVVNQYKQTMTDAEVLARSIAFKHATSISQIKQLIES